MKILQINAVYKRLSTGTNVYEINTLLNQVGHQCVAAFSEGKVTDPRSEYKIGQARGKKLHALLSRITGLQGYFSRHATKKLLRYMDEFQPDVVVLNNLHANYIHLPKLLTYLAEKDIPTVAVLHDCWFYTGKCCYYTTTNCNKWQTGCDNCPAWKQYNKSWFFDRTKKMHQDRIRLFNAIPRLGVVAVSDWLLEQAKQSPVFAKARYIQRIHNWINLNAFNPVDGASLRQKLGLEHKKVILSMAAKWENRKGLDTVLWMNDRLDDNEQIVVVGKLLPGTKLPDSIIHIPFVHGSEALAAYYSMADVFLQPSLEETFGKVTAEALACGTPVVCFDSTANPELVGEHCGAVLPVGDNQGMLDAVRETCRKGKAQYTDACSTFAQKHFNMPVNVMQYLSAFECLQTVQKPMALNILQINAVHRRLSTGRTAYEMNQSLSALGHTCATAFASGRMENPEKEYLIGSGLGQKAHALLSRATGLQGYFSRHATKKLLKYMNEFQPNVVVLRNLHANYIHLPKLLTYLAKKDIPTVVVLHDCWFYTGKCCHYTLAGCNKWQTGCGGCVTLKKYNKSWLFDRTAKMIADKERLFSKIPRLAVVGVSEWLTEEAKKAPVFKKAKAIERIYNWIDLTKFQPVDATAKRIQMGLDGKKVILCVASRWSDEKGLQTVLKLSEMLEENERLVVVGNLPAGLQMNERVVLVSATDSVEELVELYSMADVFLQPSPEETFGKVSAEALACGTPVVCFNSTANPELVGEGCGKVVPVGAVEELLAGAREIIACGKDCYSENCRNFASTHFDRERNIVQYEKLFRTL